MRGILAAALLLIGFGASASAQQAFGPINITNHVNGVPVTVSATSWLTVKAGDDGSVIRVRTLADLIDLQRNFANVVATFAPPTDACANRHGGPKSPVTALKRTRLFARNNQLIISMRGHIDVWSCIVGRQQFALRWRKKKIASFKIKLPTIHTWRPVAQKKEGTQRFRGRLPVYLVHKRDATVSLRTARPDITLVGRDTVVSDGSLRIVKATIRRKVYEALRRAIQPTRLKDALPAKLRKLKLAIVSTRFRALGGHAIAEIDIAGHVPAGFSTKPFQAIAARSAE